jgi:hypothetical protein
MKALEVTEETRPTSLHAVASNVRRGGHHRAEAWRVAQRREGSRPGTSFVALG